MTTRMTFEIAWTGPTGSDDAALAGLVEASFAELARETETPEPNPQHQNNDPERFLQMAAEFLRTRADRDLLIERLRGLLQPLSSQLMPSPDRAGGASETSPG